MRWGLAFCLPGHGNPQVSAWYPMLLAVYPVWETLFSSRNSQTSPYLWLLTTLSAFPAILFWNHTALLMGFSAAFVFLYCQIYWAIVRFRSPKWLMRRIPLPDSDVVEKGVGFPN